MPLLRISRFVAQEQPVVLSGDAEGDAAQKMLAWLVALPEGRRDRIVIQTMLLDEFDALVESSPLEFLTDKEGDAIDKALLWLNSLPARLASAAPEGVGEADADRHGGD